MHSQKRSTVKFLESWHQNNVNIFYVEHIKVAQIVLCLAIISEKLTPYRLIENRLFVIGMLRVAPDLWRETRKLTAAAELLNNSGGVIV